MMVETQSQMEAIDLRENWLKLANHGLERRMGLIRE